jgi:MFS family permease
VSSIYMSMWDLSAMIGPFMLGIIAHFLGYATMFALAGTIAIGAAVCLEATRRSWGRDPNVE